MVIVARFPSFQWYNYFMVDNRHQVCNIDCKSGFAELDDYGIVVS